MCPAISRVESELFFEETRKAKRKKERYKGPKKNKKLIRLILKLRFLNGLDDWARTLKKKYAGITVM